MINTIITTKNWKGNYNSRSVDFETEDQMDEYVTIMFQNEQNEKLINFVIL
jgi:hypothetical protein